jgi:rhodanese-related sulfurtransferase
VRSLAPLTLLLVATSAHAGERFTVLHVAELARLMATTPKPVLYDANVESTRTHVGVIPGAHLVPASGEVARILPEDRNVQLVFYCANKYCTASHQAAEQAIDAGYKKVAVMIDGIYGWRDAKQPLRQVQPLPAALAPAEVLALQKKNEAIVVDVREGEERHEIVDGARWMPMSEVEQATKWAAFVRGLPVDKTIVFYCAVGVRSKRVAELLRAEGLRSAYFQGPDQWKAAGLPLKPGPAR